MLRATMTATVFCLSVASPAWAGADAHCPSCIERVRTPETYGRVYRDAVIRPAQTRYHVRPARVHHTHEQVLVAPERVVHRHVPAHVGVVHERVQIAPAHRGQRRITDIMGRDILCEEDVPAQYATVARHVHVPARTERVVLPAEVRTVTRRTVEPARLVATTVPGESHRLPRTMQLSQAGTHAVPVHIGSPSLRPSW